MMQVDWTQISKNPISPEVQSALGRELRLRNRGSVSDYSAFLRDFVQGHTVLDIGVVEHDLSFTRSENWKHRHIQGWSRSVLGVDILEEEVEILRGQGFNIVCADATSDRDLGERFERVVIGDVIEHVENPVNLLRFCARHVSDEGLILVRTPNPYWYRFIYNHVRDDSFVPNSEHIAWISPFNALEIGRRAGLELKDYWMFQTFTSTPVNRALKFIRDRFMPRSSLFTSAYLYVFQQPRA